MSSDGDVCTQTLVKRMLINMSLIDIRGATALQIPRLS